MTNDQTIKSIVINYFKKNKPLPFRSDNDFEECIRVIIMDQLCAKNGHLIYDKCHLLYNEPNSNHNINVMVKTSLLLKDAKKFDLVAQWFIKRNPDFMNEIYTLFYI